MEAEVGYHALLGGSGCCFFVAGAAGRGGMSDAWLRGVGEEDAVFAGELLEEDREEGACVLL